MSLSHQINQRPVVFGDESGVGGPPHPSKEEATTTTSDATTTTTTTMTPQLTTAASSSTNGDYNNNYNNRKMTAAASVDNKSTQVVAVVAPSNNNNNNNNNNKNSNKNNNKVHLVRDKIPILLLDPRFRAGRALVQSGRASEGATEIFATLLENLRRLHGTDHILTAPAYYEYGNAIFRAILSNLSNSTVDNEGSGGSDGDGDGDSETKTDECKPDAASAAAGAKKPSKSENDTKQPPSRDIQKKVTEDEEDDEEQEVDDVQLALEMMETAWSILDQYVATMEVVIATATGSIGRKARKRAFYYDWALGEIPRVLVGIGDVLSHLSRHADAADALSRAIPYREQALNKLLATHRQEQQQQQQQSSSSLRGLADDGDLPSEVISFDHLKCRRQLAEVNILVAEELLSCPADQDVITTETKDVLVTAAERVDFAGGYYDKARDELQETVYLLGKLSARIGAPKKDDRTSKPPADQPVTVGAAPDPALTPAEELAKAKEDVCFLATLIMGVGEQLAAYDEAKEQKEGTASKDHHDDLRPKKKKQRT